MNKKVLSVLLALSCSFGLAGCSSTTSQTSRVDEDKEVHLCMVIGGAESNPVANVSSVKDLIKAAAKSYGKVSVIVDDSNPSSNSFSYDVPVQADNLSSSKKETIANDITNQLLDYIPTLVADDEQVDTLASVQLAARTLSSAQAETDKDLYRVMVVMDNFLPTTGGLNYLNSSMFTMDSEDIVSQLANMNEIADCSSIDQVYLYNVGDTAGTQSKLSNTQIQKLKENSVAILNEAGAKNIKICDDIPSSEEYDISSMPYVTPVPVDSTESFNDTTVLSFDSDSISFLPDSYELADEAKATDSLEKVIQYLTENPDEQIIVAGTTAKAGSSSSCKEFSLGRSQKVAQLLEKKGVNSNQIITVGLGFDNDWYINDLDSNGYLIEELAAKNRTVKILSTSNPSASKILNS